MPAPNQRVLFTKRNGSTLSEVELQYTPESETATHFTPTQATVSTICGVTETHCVVFMRDDYPDEEHWVTVVEADFDHQVTLAKRFAERLLNK